MEINFEVNNQNEEKGYNYNYLILRNKNISNFFSLAEYLNKNYKHVNLLNNPINNDHLYFNIILCLFKFNLQSIDNTKINREIVFEAKNKCKNNFMLLDKIYENFQNILILHSFMKKIKIKNELKIIQNSVYTPTFINLIKKQYFEDFEDNYVFIADLIEDIETIKEEYNKNDLLGWDKSFKYFLEEQNEKIDTLKKNIDLLIYYNKNEENKSIKFRLKDVPKISSHNMLSKIEEKTENEDTYNNKKLNEKIEEIEKMEKMNEIKEKNEEASVYHSKEKNYWKSTKNKNFSKNLNKSKNMNKSKNYSFKKAKPVTVDLDINEKNFDVKKYKVISDLNNLEHKVTHTKKNRNKVSYKLTENSNKLNENFNILNEEKEKLSKLEIEKNILDNKIEKLKKYSQNNEHKKNEIKDLLDVKDAKVDILQTLIIFEADEDAIEEFKEFYLKKKLLLNAVKIKKITKNIKLIESNAKYYKIKGFFRNIKYYIQYKRKIKVINSKINRNLVKKGINSLKQYCILKKIINKKINNKNKKIKKNIFSYLKENKEINKNKFKFKKFCFKFRNKYNLYDLFHLMYCYRNKTGILNNKFKDLKNTRDRATKINVLNIFKKELDAKINSLYILKLLFNGFNKFLFFKNFKELIVYKKLENKKECISHNYKQLAAKRKVFGYLKHILDRKNLLEKNYKEINKNFKIRIYLKIVDIGKNLTNNLEKINNFKNNKKIRTKNNVIKFLYNKSKNKISSIGLISNFIVKINSKNFNIFLKMLKKHHVNSLNHDIIKNKYFNRLKYNSFISFMSFVSKNKTKTWYNKKIKLLKSYINSKLLIKIFKELKFNKNKRLHFKKLGDNFIKKRNFNLLHSIFTGFLKLNLDKNKYLLFNKNSFLSNFVKKEKKLFNEYNINELNNKRVELTDINKLNLNFKSDLKDIKIDNENLKKKFISNQNKLWSLNKELIIKNEKLKENTINDKIKLELDQELIKKEKYLSQLKRFNNKNQSKNNKEKQYLEDKTKELENVRKYNEIYVKYNKSKDENNDIKIEILEKKKQIIEENINILNLKVKNLYDDKVSKMDSKRLIKTRNERDSMMNKSKFLEEKIKVTRNSKFSILKNISKINLEKLKENADNIDNQILNKLDSLNSSISDININESKNNLNENENLNSSIDNKTIMLDKSYDQHKLEIMKLKMEGLEKKFDMDII